MKFSINPNYILASDLFLISALLGLVNVILSPDVFNTFYTMSIGVISLAFLVFIAILIRIGVEWVKYVLATLLVVGFLMSYKFMISEFTRSPVHGVINLIQNIAQISAVVILFIEKPLRKK